MTGLRNLLDKLPLAPLLIFAVLLALAPFVPEPHLWEKLKMLGTGMLTKPVDMFDLLMHSAPVLLLIAKLTLGSKK